MSARLSPADLARQDQDQARLADLTRVAHRHHRYCPQPGVCPGLGVEAFLEDTDCAERYRLLMLAVAELARLSYGREARDG